MVLSDRFIWFVFGVLSAGLTLSWSVYSWAAGVTLLCGILLLRAIVPIASPVSNSFFFLDLIVIRKPHVVAAPFQIRVDIPELKQRPHLPSKKVTSTALALPGRPNLIQCYNPATLGFLGEIPVTSADDVSATVLRARNAQKNWASSSWSERRSVMLAIYTAIRAQTDDILLVSSTDTGKQREPPPPQLYKCFRLCVFLATVFSP